MHAYIQQMAHENVNCSIIYNIPKLETAQIPNSRVDTQIRVYSFIQYNNMQEWEWTTTYMQKEWISET